ncbi:MAG: peptidoglycan DD-metalloendopeptidase family protein [Ignavibacteriae bacterium]|nr:T9SS C-terminal target domain-containing protein [Ignavibacteriota bacterium]NOH00288.1 peptidoglycan DD-metalloendopeptidase family protein [Ignavibacteriota bacterium]
MRTNKTFLSAITAILFMVFINTINAQTNNLQAASGGEYIFNEQNLPCLTEDQRAEIVRLNNESIMKLKAEGKLTDNPNKAASSQFGFPVKAASSLLDFGFYGISNFIDQDPNFPDQLLDYMGGQRTYDLENGYNHKGTDIFTWPFGWYKMDNDEVEIISVADGVIINKFDGNFDRNCGFGNGNWNAVYVRHTNDEVVWYGHMKSGSLTSKGIGDTVSAGEYLGIIGSSGSSTGPHLHLEVYDSFNQLIDPWFGTSNPTITSSWWAEQKPYYDSKINKVATHSAFPVFPACPETEIVNFKDEFGRGDTVFLVTYYQDQLKNQNSDYTVTTPENTNLWQWNHSMDDDHYAAAWWGWYVILPANASLGEWKFNVFYENTSYTHNFTVTDSPTGVADNENIVTEFSLEQNYPNPFNPSTTIKYSIPVSSFVTLKVYDLLGKVVASLVNESKAAGNYKINFDAKSLSSGIYFYKIEAGNFNAQRKLVLLK